MTNTIQQLSQRVCPATVPFAILAMWATFGAHGALAQSSGQPAFPSAAEATQSLFQAVQNNNADAIAKILAGPTELASCGDDAQDKIEREMFAQKYQEMHRLGREVDKSVTLYIGAENWPFPIPLVENNGSWRFDSDAGKKEVLFRRIGDNELTAIEICHELVAAGKQPRTNSSTPDQGEDPLAAVVSKAASDSARVLIHGYYFRPLEARAKGTAAAPAFIAYPAEYRSSGVMTFIVTGNDVIYEKDLGADTSAAATAMTSFHKDSTWYVASN
jgi:hypothetical protein